MRKTTKRFCFRRTALTALFRLSTFTTLIVTTITATTYAGEQTGGRPAVTTPSTFTCDSAVASTRTHYDGVASEYAAKHAHSSPVIDQLRARFLARIPAGGKILDLGSGPGRDARYFDSLGYQVTAVDISPAMIALVQPQLSSRSRALVLPAQDLAFDQEFDGVWAIASLIHIPPELMPKVLAGIHRALKPKGIFLSSLITGVGTPDVGEIESKGRYFNRMTQPTFLAFMAQNPGLVLLPEDTFANADDYHGNRAPTASFGFFNVMAERSF